MQLARVLIGWLLVSLVFLLADLLRVKRTGAKGSAPRWQPFAEAVPFTLLAALWFASLGRGMWPLVFVLLALVAESGRLGEFARGSWVKTALGFVPSVGRMVVAGLVLRWVL